MQSVAIVGLGVVASFVYGIVHDYVVVRLCPEYFTVTHARLFDTDSPLLLAALWSAVGTWWMGLPLGAGLAAAAQAGPRPQRSLLSLIVPVLLLMGFTACAAVTAGVVGYCLSSLSVAGLPDALAKEVPPYRQVVFLAVLWAQRAAYLVGGGTGLLLIVQTWRSRRASGAASARR